MGEELHRLQAEENSGRGSASKLPAVPTISVWVHGGELKATAHCSTRSDRAAQVRIMRWVGKRLRRLQAAAASGPGSSGVLSSMHFDTVL
jgi:hypothetical protein